jgi:diaminopimelate epimerase
MQLHFFKYQGTGNDFVIIDNRAGEIELTMAQVKHICDRRFGIGADGLMLLNKHATLDFEMKYYNADGNESSMCGNGGRCLVQFAYKLGIHKNEYHFEAIDGLHEASIDDKDWVRLKMKDVDNVLDEGNEFVLDTGSPHYVQMVTDIKNMKVKEHGAAIRYSDDYKQMGINVNFVETMDEDSIFVRTYERGVEDETMSCGTGVTAAALVCAHNDRGFNRIEVHTLGGHLAVEFNKHDETHFDDIWLCGPALFVYDGKIQIN